LACHNAFWLLQPKSDNNNREQCVHIELHSGPYAQQALQRVSAEHFANGNLESANQLDCTRSKSKSIDEIS